MYTLTRKLSVICLTVVLSFLVYGCGGSSKQALITDVSLDMVADLTPDAGTYNVQPGGTANAGDVTFACPDEGSSCEVTVADDGTVTSAGGMATAMTSASALARVAAEEAARVATEEALRVAAAALAEAVAAAEGVARLAAEGVATEAAETLRLAVAAATAAAEGVARLAAEGVATAAAETLTEAVAAATEAAEEVARLAAEGVATEAAETLRLAVAAATEAAEEVARLAAEGVATEATETLTEAVAAAKATAEEVARLAAEGVATEATETLTEAVAAAKATAEEVARLAAEGVATEATETLTEAVAAAKATAEEVARLAAEGVATAAAETLRLAVAVAVEATTDALTTVTQIKPDLALGYGRVTPDVYVVEPGATEPVPDADVEIKCPLGGIRCTVVITVNDDGEVFYTSLGGVATVVNTGAVLDTRTAVALTESENGLANLTVEAPAVVVTSDTDGVTEITLTPVSINDAAADAVEYDPGRPVVDTHVISKWPGQTMNRSDANDLPNPEEATVYTNIGKATRQHLEYGGEGGTEFPLPSLPESLYVVNTGQGDDESLNENDIARSFMGSIGGVSGTFTCVADEMCTDIVTRINLGDQRVFTNMVRLTGWTFESEEFVESQATQDSDYMYFGYWLQSPAKPGGDTPADKIYRFAAFYGGAPMSEFVVPSALMMYNEEPLTATYKGGAAGRYVTRKLRIKEPHGVDPQSPGFHGRFTAKASLTANFGMHPDFAGTPGDTDDPNTQNMIKGYITDFKDGATELGFKVTLKLSEIGTGTIDGAVASAVFSETPTNTVADGAGNWSAQFFGPQAIVSADDVTDNENPATKLPSGIAGKFNVKGNYTHVVGAFAAE